jgi:iron complex transport system permease protein
MKRALLLLLLAIAVVLGTAASLLLGKVSLPLRMLSAGPSDPLWPILSQLRLPRMLLGAMAGAALGLSGAVLQGYLRNPLADPGVLGVGACSALGAVLMLYLGVGFAAPWSLPLSGMLGALLGIGLLVGLSGTNSSPLTFLLAGVVFNIFASAATAFLMSIAKNPFTVGEIVNWLMGALTDRAMSDVWLALPGVVVGCSLLLLTHRALDALSLGEESARSLGINPRLLRWLVLLGVGASVGSVVAVMGMVGFVGLIVPHLLRPLVGAQPSRLLLPCMLGGAALTLWADTLVRLIAGPNELKLGIALTLLGAPLFMALLLKERRRLP